MAGIRVHTASPINNHTASIEQNATQSTTVSDGEHIPLGSSVATVFIPERLPVPPTHDRLQGSQSDFRKPVESTSPLPVQEVNPAVRAAQILPSSGLRQYNAPSTSIGSLPQPSSLPSAHTPSSPDDLSHPPGYRQQQASFNDRPAEDGGTTSLLPSSLLAKVGGADIPDKGSAAATSHEDGAVWGSAVSWAKAAGEKLGEKEAQVWKLLNR